MKVNIKGRGIVPRVNQLAPVYNVDLGKNDIQFLLNFNNLKVYETKSGLLIRPDTIDEMFAKSQPSMVKKETPIVVGIDLAKTDEPEVEQTNLDIDSLIPEEASTITEEKFYDGMNEQEDFVDVEPVNEEVIDETEDVDVDVVEDTTVDETSSNQSYPSKKNKNKKKNRS